jgi:hypothetical protein
VAVKIVPYNYNRANLIVMLLNIITICYSFVSLASQYENGTGAILGLHIALVAMIAVAGLFGAILLKMYPKKYPNLITSKSKERIDRLMYFQLSRKTDVKFAEELAKKHEDELM